MDFGDGLKFNLGENCCGHSNNQFSEIANNLLINFISADGQWFSEDAGSKSWLKCLNTIKNMWREVNKSGFLCKS